ncbi:MAG: hypothetical protein WD043_12040 [Gemmatimonadales bacterium]
MKPPMRPPFIRPAIGGVLAICGILPVLLQVEPLSGQARVELAPIVGLYAPTADVIDQPVTQQFCETELVCNDILFQFSLRQKTTMLVGARGAIRLSRRLGVEAHLAHAPSGTTAILSRSGTAVTTDTSASITAGSLRLLVRVTAHDSRTSLDVGAGFSLLTFGGDSYSSMEGTTRFGTVLVSAVTLPLNHPGFSGGSVS